MAEGVPDRRPSPDGTAAEREVPARRMALPPTSAGRRALALPPTSAVLASVFLLAAMALLVLPVPATAAEPVTVTGEVRFTGGPDTLIAVDGRRYHGAIELLADGQVVNDVDVERYVAGVAEMPSRWPMAALEAQAVAARTYAWWSAESASHRGYDLCDTTACQVYRGAEVVLDGGERWAAAVAATAGQVLVDDDGAPVLARYFSTSGGRTYANEEVFPSTGARDHLVAIDDPYDEVSPYHRWEVRFNRAEFDEILARGERLAAAVPVAEVERTGAVDDVDARFVVRGEDGTEVEVGAVELRDFLSRVAVSRFPDRFPTRRADGLRPLPSTVPSSRFTAEVTDGEVVLSGRGWGHGVGMGQYGARGRAAAGHAAEEILAAYYGGLTPVASDALPDRIRVGLGTPRDEVVVSGDDLLRIETEGEVVVERALGPWTATRTAQGWRLEPADAGQDLAVAPTRLVDALTRPGEAVAVETELTAHALLHLEVRAEDGEVVRTDRLGVAEPGVHAARWRYLDDDGEVVPAGTYAVALVGEDADGVRGGSPVAVEVAARDLPGPDEGASPWGPWERASGTLVLSAAAALVLLLVVILLLVRSARRPSP